MQYTDEQLEQMYEDHDCHAGPEDGCEVCDLYGERFYLPEDKEITEEDREARDGEYEDSKYRYE
jgi:hypothetical protein